jgi:hypothetical protein
MKRCMSSAWRCSHVTDACSIWPWALEVRWAAKGPGGQTLIIHWDLPMEARGHHYQESQTPTDTDRCTPGLSLTLDELAQQTPLSVCFLTQKGNIYIDYWLCYFQGYMGKNVMFICWFCDLALGGGTSPVCCVVLRVQWTQGNNAHEMRRG